jgi:hypothetical protein
VASEVSTRDASHGSDYSRKPIFMDETMAESSRQCKVALLLRRASDFTGRIQ